jgi:hypothetical protein
MGFMDFLKKKDDAGLNLGSDSLNFSNNGLPQDTPNISSPSFGNEFSSMNSSNNMNPSMSMSSMNSQGFGQSSMTQSTPQGSGMERDLQMISLKLDAIKSELDAMNQRLKNLESIAEREQQQSKTNKQQRWY